jgi:hypothetical protein
VKFPIVSGRVLPLCAALLAGVAVTTAAPGDTLAAKQAKVPIAIGSISGPQSAKIRKKVMEVLRKGGTYEVTDAEDVKAGGTTNSYATMAKALGAEAIVVGVVSKRFNLTLTVYGANGERLDTVELQGGGGSFGLLKKIQDELEIVIADPIGKGKPGGGAGAKAADADADKGKKAPEEEEPEIAEESEPEAPVDGEDAGGASEGDSGGDSGGGEVETPSEHAKPGLRPLEVIVGGRGYNRDFRYTGVRRYTDLDGTELHPYKLPLGPALLAMLRFYPGALFRDDAWSHIGISAGYEFGIATTTDYQGTALSTSSGAWQVGLRGRLPIATHELGIFAEYGAHTFVMKGDEVSAPGRPYAVVPDEKFTFIRTGIDAQFRFGKVLLGAHVAPRFMRSLAELDLGGVWFPGATGSGIDAGIMGGYDVLSFLSIVGGADFLRYGFDFNGMPPCEFQERRCVVAGGATDTYISGWLGVMFRLDGSAATTEASVTTDASATSTDAGDTTDASDTTDDGADAE